MKHLREGKNGNAATDSKSGKSQSSNGNGNATDGDSSGGVYGYPGDAADGNAPLGAPIYFFFELGTDNLVEESQMVNIDEIARVAKKYGLGIEITGAADKATGTEMINSNLDSLRASFIAGCLKERGIEKNWSRLSQRAVLMTIHLAKRTGMPSQGCFCHDINEQP